MEITWKQHSPWRRETLPSLTETLESSASKRVAKPRGVGGTYWRSAERQSDRVSHDDGFHRLITHSSTHPEGAQRSRLGWSAGHMYCGHVNPAPVRYEGPCNQRGCTYKGVGPGTHKPCQCPGEIVKQLAGCRGRRGAPGACPHWIAQEHCSRRPFG